MNTEQLDGFTELTTDAEYAPQEGRLAQYFRAATLMSSALMVATYTLHTMPQVTHLHVAILTAVAAPTAAAACIPMALTWKAHAAALPTRKVDRRRLDKLCIAVYASTVLLIAAPLTALSLGDMAYAMAAVPLAPAAGVMYLLVRKGARLGHAWGTAQFGPHDGELRRFFRLAAGLTVPAYAGLFGCVLSHFRGMAHGHGGVHAVECLVLYTAALGIALMLLTSVPPALYFRETRAVLVDKFAGVLSYAQLGLVGLAGLMAAQQIVRGFVVLAFAADIAVACLWLARECEQEPDVRVAEQPNAKACRARGASPGVAPLVVNSVAFTALMGFYCAHVSGGRPFGWPEKASVVAVAAAFMSNLSGMVLCGKDMDDESVAFAAAMARKATNVLVVVAALITVVVMTVPHVILVGLVRSFG